MRAKTLWEIGLHIQAIRRRRTAAIATWSSRSAAAGEPSAMAAARIRLGHPGRGSGKGRARSRIRQSVGAAHPGLSRRAFGLFRTALPVRIIASIRAGIASSSWCTHERAFARLTTSRRSNIRCVSPCAKTRRISTLVLIEQAFALHGFKLQDIEAWGGRIITCGGPSDVRRLEPLARGEIDAVFDEGIKVWLNEALAAGLVPLDMAPAELRRWDNWDGGGLFCPRRDSRAWRGISIRSISAAGRSTPARRCPSRWPRHLRRTRRPRSGGALEKNTGGSALHMVSETSRRRWTFRSTSALSAGIASTHHRA